MFKQFLLTLIFIFSLKAEIKEITTSDNVKLFVQIEGKGIPCLYIHGGPGAGSHWLKKFTGNIFDKHYQMIYLDQRGVGRSTSPDNKDYSPERMIKDFEEIREALGIKKWIIMGHSFGGIMQMQYIEKHPDVISGMLMFNCTLDIMDSFRNGWLKYASQLLNTEPDYSALNGKMPDMKKFNKLIAALKEKDLLWEMGYLDKNNDIEMNKSFGDIKNWNGDFSGTAMSIEGYFNDYRNSAKKIKIPVLFFYGTQDFMIGPEHYKNIKFPNMLLWKSKSKHMPFMENKDDIENALNQFHKKYGL